MKLKNTLFVFSLLFLSTLAFAAKPVKEKKHFYIATTGSDQNDGSIEKPWRTLQHAFKKATGGAVIQLRGGVYHSALELSNFKTTNGKSITVQAYPGEKVVFDGTRTITSKWKLWQKGIYRTQLSEDIWQLFTDEDIADMARWPNTSFVNDSIWRMTQSMRSADGGFHKNKYTGKSKLGVLYDADFRTGEKAGFHEGDSRYGNHHKLTSLAESNINFTGAYAVLNIGNWLTWTRKIESHQKGQDFFVYNTEGIKKNMLKNYGAYYIYGLQALDKNNEWWYDKESKYLYYKPEEIEDLSSKVFKGRVQDFAISLHRCENIDFKGISFFSTGYFIDNCENISFENCQFKYLSANKIALGSTQWFTEWNKGNATANKTAAFFKGKNNRFVNNTVFRSNSPMYFTSDHMLVSNARFEDIEWDVNTNGASGSVLIGANSTITNCTLTRAGNSEGIRAKTGGVTIQFNRVFDVGNLQHDGAGINVGTTAQYNTLVSQNWVHDANRQGVRFDYHGTGIHNADGEVHGDGIYRNNVTWNTQPNQVKGDRHLVLNNTVININRYKDPSKELFNMSIQGFKAMHEIEANAHSIIRNNLAKLTHRGWNLILKGTNTEYRIRKDGYKQPKAQVLPGINDHNTDVAGAAYKYLRDPENLDFRPKEGSPIIDAGAVVDKNEIPSKVYTYVPLPFEGKNPDIGAYEYGAKQYWIPGQQLPRASSAIPASGATVKSDVNLMFLEAYKTNTHLVYLGTSPEEMTKVAVLKETNIFVPSDKLVPGTYYWRVDAVANGKTTKGVLWHFTVQ